MFIINDMSDYRWKTCLDSEYLPIIKKLQMRADEGRHSISQENGEIIIDSTLIHSKINDINADAPRPSLINEIEKMFSGK